MHATFNTLFNAQLYNYENSLKRCTTLRANCTNLHNHEMSQPFILIDIGFENATFYSNTLKDFQFTGRLTNLNQASSITIVKKGLKIRSTTQMERKDD